MSEAKVPLDKYQRLENLFATQSKLVVMTGGFFLIGHTVLFFAFAAAHGGWFKVILGLFGILMSVAWFVCGGTVLANYNFSSRSLMELENNLPGPERVYLTMVRQRDTLPVFLRIFTPAEMLLKILPAVVALFWVILMIFRPA